MEKNLNVDEIREKVKSYLEDDEEIISEHTSKNGNSYYVSILTPPNEILNIRISNHPSIKNNEVYSKIDINDPDYEQKLKKSIISGKRKRIDYLRYAILNIIYSSESEKLKFYVDNSYGTFTDETAMPVFYAEFKKKNKTEFINLSELFNGLMGSLYKYGFLIIYRSQFGKTEVSLTPGAIKVIKYLESRYKNFWSKDSRNIRWWHVDITKNILYKNKVLLKKEKQQSKDRKIKIIRSKRWWITNIVVDIRRFVKKKFSRCLKFLKTKLSRKKSKVGIVKKKVSILERKINKSEYLKSDKEFKKIEKKSIDKKMKEQFARRGRSKLGNIVDEQTMEKLSKLKLELDK